METSRPSSSTTARRVRIACDSCRSRRKRCDGVIPCRSCRARGDEASCVARTQARPNRARSPQNGAPSQTSSEQVNYGGRVAQQAEEWLEDLAARSDHYLDLSLQHVDSLLQIDSPPLPRRYPDVEKAALDTFLADLPGFFSWLDIDLLRTALDHSLSDDGPADHHALALSAVCLGLPGRDEWSFQGGTVRDWPGLEYFRSAWVYLQSVESPSLIALYACHCLHFLALICCGPQDLRAIVKRMAWHAEAFATEEDRDKHLSVLFATYYKDSLLATLLQCPPFLSTSFASAMAYVELYHSVELKQGLAPDKMWGALVDLERHIASGSRHGTNATSPTGNATLEVGRRMDKFASILAAEQRIMKRPIACYFAHVRYSWARILNVFPALQNPGCRMSSLSVIANSASRIIRSYDALSRQPTIPFGWCELRRLSTSAWLISRCIWEDELEAGEGQALLQSVLTICESRWSLWEPGRALVGNLRNFAPLLGLDEIARGADGGEAFVTKSKSLSHPATFDFTVPQ